MKAGEGTLLGWMFSEVPPIEVAPVADCGSVRSGEDRVALVFWLGADELFDLAAAGAWDASDTRPAIADNCARLVLLLGAGELFEPVAVGSCDPRHARSAIAKSADGAASLLD